MRKKSVNRLLSFVMALVMVVTMFPYKHLRQNSRAR